MNRIMMNIVYQVFQLILTFNFNPFEWMFKQTSGSEVSFIDGFGVGVK